MHSSISSSKSRAPRGLWGAAWLIAVVSLLATASGLETALRHWGFFPSVSEDAELWARERAAVYARYPGERVVVLLGGSRMQLDVAPQVVSEELGGARVVQLAIDASSGLPILEDLGKDTAFSGLVLVSLLASHFYADPGRSAEYVAHFRSRDENLNRDLNQSIALEIQSRMALRNSYVSLRSLVTTLVEEGHPPRPPYIRMLPDRSKLADYTRLDIVEHRANRLAQDRVGLERRRADGLDQDELMKGLTRVNEAVDAIRARGGNVALLRLPTGAELEEQREEVFPRAEFWDRIAAHSTALALYCGDIPAFGGFTFPDESHLDYRDAPEFTRVLVRSLQQAGFFVSSAAVPAGTRPAIPRL